MDRDHRGIDGVPWIFWPNIEPGGYLGLDNDEMRMTFGYEADEFW